MGSLNITSNPRLLIQKYNGWVMFKRHILPLVVLLGLMTPQSCYHKMPVVVMIMQNFL